MAAALVLTAVWKSLLDNGATLLPSDGAPAASECRRAPRFSMLTAQRRVNTEDDDIFFFFLGVFYSIATVNILKAWFHLENNVSPHQIFK